MATTNNSDIGKASQTLGDLTLTAYPGEGMVLIAMSLADSASNNGDKNLAGFAIYRGEQGKTETPLMNRLSFASGITKNSSAQEWFPSSDNPFQRFRWVDVPPDGFDNPITYRVVAKYFTGRGATLKDGPSASVTVPPPQRAHTNFDVAFTRGYASSQAYVDKFDNKDIRPKTKTPTFDTKPYQEQYVWLGAKARAVIRFSRRMPQRQGRQSRCFRLRP